MEIKPDKKLITKQWYVLLTISFIIILAGVILQITVPLGKASSSEVAIILWPITGGVILLMWLISAPLIILWIKNLTYYIEDDRLTIHKGILSKIEQNIPYRAITDFQLHRSLYDRFLNIGAIRIQTAGQHQNATGYEGQLSGLVKWRNLIEDLRGRVKKLHPLSEAAGVREVDQLSKDEKLNVIIEELKGIRQALEEK